MATPADVIAGEVIEVEWGNAVRDWACFSIEFGGATDVSLDSSTSATWESGASVSFTKPADWVGYKVAATGTVSFSAATTGPSGIQGNARISIGGNTGDSYPMVLGGNYTQTHTGVATCEHQVTGLTGNATVAVQYNGTSGLSKYASNVSFIAIRTG